MVSGAAAEDAVDERKLIENERKKELKNAANGSSADGFFNAPQMDDTNEIVLPQDKPMIPPAVDVPVAPPSGSAPAPINPEDDFQQKAQQINATSAVTPGQAAQLDALLSRYMADEISTAEYQAERNKILAGGQ